MPSPAFHAVVTLSTLVDAAAAGVGLFAPWPRGEGPDARTIDLVRVARAAGLTALAFALKLPFLGLHAFGLIRLAYIDLVVLVPLAGLAVLLASRRLRVTPLARLAAWAGLGLAAVGVYATLVEPFRLRLETARVPVAAGREGRGAIRIGVMTDFQTDQVTDYERGAVDRLMAQRPDVILLPGDVFQGDDDAFDRELPALRALLGRLAAPGGVYLVPGDVDRPVGRVHRLAEGTNITPLVNEVVSVTVGDRKVTIGGLDLDYRAWGAQSVVHRLETLGGEGDIRILFAHRPDAVLSLRESSRIDLVVAGHTHGGQVVIPFYGPPMTLSDVPRRMAAGGLHAIWGNAIYVSRGVGCERGQAPRIRFLCPPEISLLTLESGPDAPTPR